MTNTPQAIAARTRRAMDAGKINPKRPPSAPQWSTLGAKAALAAILTDAAKARGVFLEAPREPLPRAVRKVVEKLVDSPGQRADYASKLTGDVWHPEEYRREILSIAETWVWDFYADKVEDATGKVGAEALAEYMDWLRSATLWTWRDASRRRLLDREYPTVQRLYHSGVDVGWILEAIEQLPRPVNGRRAIQEAP